MRLSDCLTIVRKLNRRVLGYDWHPAARRRLTRRTFAVECLEDRTLLSNAPVFAPDTYSFSINADAAIAAEIGTVLADDMDGDALVYFIDSGNNLDLFTLDSSSGTLKVDADLLTHDGETFNLQVSVDDGTQTDTASVSVVINANTGPTFNQNTYTFNVSEDAVAGTEIGTLAFSNPNSELIDFFINTGDSNGVFSIDDNGKLSLDTDMPDPSGTTYQLNVSVTATISGETDTATVNITVTDAGSSQSYSFNTTSTSPLGSLVGSLEDETGSSSAAAYSVVSGDESMFTVDPAGDVTVNGDLTLEAGNTYVFVVDITDGGTVTTITVTIDVLL